MAAKRKVQKVSPADCALYERVTVDELIDIAAGRIAVHEKGGLVMGNASLYDENGIDGLSGDPITEAIDLLKNGYAKGRDSMVEMAAEVDKVDEIDNIAIGLDVAGYRPDVPLYLTGEPACMQIATEERRKPLVKIVAAACYSASIDADEVFHYGVGLASLVQAYERAGYSTEVIACFCSVASDNEKLFNRLDVELKAAGQRLDIDRLAFVFCHESMLRRLKFAWLEMEEPTSDYVDAGDYGCSCSPADGDICIPSLHDSKESRAATKSVAASVSYFRKLAAAQTAAKG